MFGVSPVQEVSKGIFKTRASCVSQSGEQRGKVCGNPQPELVWPSPAVSLAPLAIIKFRELRLPVWSKHCLE